MADVRALLAAERASRRINHPHLTYSKAGVLTCNVCHLNVKSESLWEGHLRSANHRKNAAQATQAQESTASVKGLKRKIQDVDETLEREDDENTVNSESTGDIEGRKKARGRPESLVEDPAEAVTGATMQVMCTERATLGAGIPAPSTTFRSAGQDAAVSPLVAPVQPMQAAVVDEDEWAAFEREVAPLAQGQQAQPQGQPDYAGATISAAPVSAAQVAELAETEKRRRLELDAEDEKEEEERRLEEEFDVMEEMEGRVRKLKEKREALRSGYVPMAGIDTGQATQVADLGIEDGAGGGQNEAAVNEDEGEDEDDVDDWYS